MALTALQLIRSSLRLIGEAGESETLSAEDADNCLATLNEMMEHWNSVPFMTFQTRIDILSWATPFNNPKTIGAGATFNVLRPLRLERACTGTVGGVENELFIIDSRSSYDRIRLKGVTTTNIWAIYYDPGVPLGSLYLIGTPAATTPISLATPSPLQTFATLSTLINLPEGYQEAMKYNLALKLGPDFGGANQIPESVTQTAPLLVQALQGQNKTRISGPIMANPPASAGP